MSASGTGVPVKMCECTAATNVRDLCVVHKTRREAILNRLKHRRHRAKLAGRPLSDSTAEASIVIPGKQTQAVAASLDQILVLQTRITEKNQLRGAQLPRDVVELFDTLTYVRAALYPLLQRHQEELIEMERPGGVKRNIKPTTRSKKPRRKPRRNAAKAP